MSVLLRNAQRTRRTSHSVSTVVSVLVRKPSPVQRLPFVTCRCMIHGMSRYMRHISNRLTFWWTKKDVRYEPPWTFIACFYHRNHSKLTHSLRVLWRIERRLRRCRLVAKSVSASIGSMWSASCIKSKPNPNTRKASLSRASIRRQSARQSL